jgi:ribosomal protein S18 acetylase RimI-like enzyme
VSTAEEARAVIVREGIAALSIDDLTMADLHHIAWSGDPHHLTVVRDALDRVVTGDLEYLAVRTPSGGPVAKVSVDFARYPEAGYLSQFATNPALQGLGIGSYLMAGAERRVLSRGRRVTRICVEHDNVKARALYERLGYVAIGEEVDSWGRTGPDGTVVQHCAEVTLMRKQLD